MNVKLTKEQIELLLEGLDALSDIADNDEVLEEIDAVGQELINLINA